MPRSASRTALRSSRWMVSVRDGRRVLVDSAQIAHLLDVGESTVRAWASPAGAGVGFPAPVGRVKSDGHWRVLFDVAEVEQWARGSGRWPDAPSVDPSLLGSRELAARLGVAKRTFDSWRPRPGFPEPDGVVKRPGGGYVAAAWRWETIEAWAKAEGRLPDTDEEN